MPSMIFLFLIVAPAMAIDTVPSGFGGTLALAGTEYAQLALGRRIIIRVPALVTRRSGPPPQEEIKWKEKKSLRCLPMRNVVGAAITRSDSIDLILSDQTRVRARLDNDCQSADFYSGFYMEPTDDQRLCADRDMVHARNGAMCEVDQFRRLVVKK